MSDETFEPVVIQINSKKKVTTRSKNQGLAVQAIKDNQLIFLSGSAGSGKTIIACAVALEMLHNGETEKIIITKPMVEAGDTLGFLPGTVDEKSFEGLQVLYSTFELLLGKEKFKTYLKDYTIKHQPLSWCRGTSIYDVLICEEAQNMTKGQMKLLLTRISGKNSKFIFTGDWDQIDIKPKSNSGFLDAIKRTENIEGVSVIEFGVEDVQRSKIVKDIIKAYAD